MQFDYSTIDLELLRKFPRYRVPFGHHASKRVGNECFLHAPGYPTYFTRSAWDARGNHPKKNPGLFITDPTNGRHHLVDGIDLRVLWKPLQYVDPNSPDHDTVGQGLRLYIWMQQVYAHDHEPVTAIRAFYPEHTPVEDWITAPPSDDGSDWWERYDRQMEIPSQQNWAK